MKELVEFAAEAAIAATALSLVLYVLIHLQ